MRLCYNNDAMTRMHRTSHHVRPLRSLLDNSAPLPLPTCPQLYSSPAVRVALLCASSRRKSRSIALAPAVGGSIALTSSRSKGRRSQPALQPSAGRCSRFFVGYSQIFARLEHMQARMKLAGRGYVTQSQEGVSPASKGDAVRPTGLPTVLFVTGVLGPRESRKRSAASRCSSQFFRANFCVCFFASDLRKRLRASQAQNNRWCCCCKQGGVSQTRVHGFMLKFF
jgi:hypothetical protein